MQGRCLSNKYLWKCGVQKNFQRTQQGALYLKEGKKEGFFISRVYDSGQRKMEWGRLVLDIDRNFPIKAHVWLFDELQEDQLIRKRAKSELAEGRMEDWLYRVKERAQYHSNYRELLLYGKGSGRYARIAIEVFPEDGYGRGLFRGYQLTFPKESFTKYLPAIYRDNLQLDRFLSVQQSIYIGLEEKIDSIERELDYEFCDSKQLLRLAKWMGWEGLVELMEPERDEKLLRELLGRGVSLGCRKGTCGYYTELASILTGRDAVMVEEPEEGRATVLVLGHVDKGRERFLDWMRKDVPIGMDLDFVALHNSDRLDGQFFLDETARLSKYESELVRGGVSIEKMRLM